MTNPRLHRRANPTVPDKLRRLIWNIVQATAYGWSPVPMHGWRRFLLKLFGADVGAGVRPYPTARFWAPWNVQLARGSVVGPGVNCYSVTMVSIGAGAIVSQYTHLCAATHDFRDPTFPLVVGTIEIGEGAWVAAEAFVGPGVHIAPYAVVAARAVVVRDVAARVVVAGNPARVVGAR